MFLVLCKNGYNFIKNKNKLYLFIAVGWHYAQNKGGYSGGFKCVS